MAGQPRTIDAEIPGPQATQEFTLDPGVVFDLEAVYVEIDASGAGGPVTAELTLLEQSGVVIAKKRQSETVDAGAAGTATWALRLDDDDGGVTPPAGPPDLPEWTVGFEVAVPAATEHPFVAGDLYGRFVNLWPDYFGIDPINGGLQVLKPGTYRFDMVWSALTADQSAFAPSPELLLVKQTATGWMDPHNPIGDYKPTGPGGYGSWLAQSSFSIGEIYIFSVDNTDPANDLLCSGRVNVWRQGADTGD